MMTWQHESEQKGTPREIYMIQNIDMFEKL
jgi:hypothetical protein